MARLPLFLGYLFLGGRFLGGLFLGNRMNTGSELVMMPFRMTTVAPPIQTYHRYQDLQRYVEWTSQDADHLRAAGELLRDAWPGLVDDFYDRITREPRAAKVITGGQEQIRRLKGTLQEWLAALFGGSLDQTHVERHWRVGWRHFELGVEQTFVDMALARLRDRMLDELARRWMGTAQELSALNRSLCKALDLELAVLHDAYTTEQSRRQREAERQRSEAAFRQLIESAGSLIVILNEDHTIAYINPFAEQLMGYTAESVVGKDFFATLLPERERSRVHEEIHRVLTGMPTRGYENAVLCRDGTECWVVWNAQLFDAYEGTPAVLAIGQDITARKGAEERALQAERLAAIGQTVTGLAHESRNAFQRSQACLELLALELEERPKELELVSRIQRALNHLHRLYEEVRDYAAPIKLDRQRCDLPHLWRDAWAQLEVNRQGREMQLAEFTDGTVTDCHVDWFALGQVFRNILENAIAACPDAGRIEVHCHDALLNDRPAIRVVIRDNGPGVPEEVRDHVFDAFFTTKTKGTGLGLAIAKRIVEAHGGQLVLGDQNHGAEFLVTLPRS